MANRFWVGGTATWDGTAGSKWSLTSGGAGGEAVPTQNDDVFFDAASGAVTVTLGAGRVCKSLVFTGFTGTFSSANGIDIYGNLTMATGMTLSWTAGSIVWNASCNLTSNGKVFGCDFLMGDVGLTITLQDALVTTGSFTQQFSTFNANNFDVTVASVSITGTNTRVLTMGSGTWTLTGTGNVWNATTTTGLTLNANTSTIKLTNSSASSKTFIGGGLTYNNFWNATGSTGVCIITGSNTFNDFKIDAGRNQQFTAGTTTTVTTFTVVAGGGTVITSPTAATHTLSDASGTNTVTGCTISYSVAQGGATWDATGAGNVNGGNNTGWLLPAGAVVASNQPTLLLMGVG